MNYWRILQCMSIKIIVQSIVLKLVKILLKTYNIYPISKLEGLTLLLITLYISSFQHYFGFKCLSTVSGVYGKLRHFDEVFHKVFCHCTISYNQNEFR